MECNNILLDDYKQKKRGVSRFPAPECRWGPVCWGAEGRTWPEGGSGLCGLAGASGWPRLARERRGRSAGCSEPPLCVLQTFHTSLSIPQESCWLWSFLFHFSGAFLVCFVSGHTLVSNLALSQRESHHHWAFAKGNHLGHMGKFL